MVRHIIGKQVELARSESIEDFTRIFKENLPISDKIRKFHSKFISEFSHPSDPSRSLEKWYKVFGTKNGSYSSYYRKDSYLLADSPFIYKPVISMIGQSIDPGYYGVGIKGLRILADSEVCKFEVLHHSKYSSENEESKKFISYLAEHGESPFYTDIFEDFMASYWIRHCSSKYANITKYQKKFEDFLNNSNELPFDYFLDTFHSLLTEEEPRYAKIIDRIPEITTNLPASLRYSNLRRATIERLIKIRLFNEFYRETTVKTLLNFDSIYDKLETILNKNSDPEILQLLLARYIFTLWQSNGTSWSYSSGNVVDFSLRDLSLDNNFNSVEEPKNEEDALKLPIVKQVADLILNTNIDNIDSIRSMAPAREKILSDWFGDFRDKGMRNSFDNFCFEIQNDIHNTMDTEESLNKLSEEINVILHAKDYRASPTTNILMGACTAASIGWMATLAISDPHIKVGASLAISAGFTLLHYYSNNLKGIQVYGVNGISKSKLVYGKIINSAEIPLKLQQDMDGLSFKCQFVNLPYGRLLNSKSMKPDPIYNKAQFGSAGDIIARP